MPRSTFACRIDPLGSLIHSPKTGRMIGSFNVLISYWTIRQKCGLPQVLGEFNSLTQIKWIYVLKRANLLWTYLSSRYGRTNQAFATATQPFGRLQQVFPYLLRSFCVPPTVTRALKPSVAWSAVLAETPPRYGHVSSSYYRGAFTLPM